MAVEEAMEGHNAIISLSWAIPLRTSGAEMALLGGANSFPGGAIAPPDI